MLLPLLVLAFYAVALLVAAWMRARRAWRVFRWVADSPDKGLRRLLVCSAAPGLALAATLAVRGLDPVASFAVGALLMFGVIAAAAGVLRIEGALVETGSEQAVRVALGLPAPTSATGRAVAVAIGCCLAGGAAVLCWQVAAP